MQVRHITSLRELERTLKHDLTAITRKAIKATRAAARKGRAIAKKKAPAAFGELRDGIDVDPLEDGARIRSSAPHSCAVEAGSRPHWPPLEPILAWVKLRGAQGIHTKRRLAPSEAPKAVAAMLRGKVQGKRGERYLPVDAALEVANAIRAAIAKRGTKPTWFMHESAQGVALELDEVFERVLSEELA